jgi:hypothetical protein
MRSQDDQERNLIEKKKPVCNSGKAPGDGGDYVYAVCTDESHLDHAEKLANRSVP